MTKLYFHAASSGVSGTLPNTEQSSLTLTKQADAVTVNRSMSPTIGTSETSLSIAQGTGTYYYTKFVSPLLYQTSVAANTWNYRFAAMSDDIGNNFPVSGNNAAVRVTAYVWKPSNGTKYANIIDGTSAATVDEGAASTKLWKVTTFSGSQVTGLTSGDAVIVFEVWFSITIGTGPSGNCLIYFDGTDDTYAEGATVTSGASYIETPETLQLTPLQNVERTAADTLTLTESTAKVLGRPRTGADTLTLTEDMARLSAKARSGGADTVTIAETQGRLAAKQRATTEQTITESETVDRVVTPSGPGGITRTGSDSIGITDSNTRQIAKWRRIG